MTFKAHLCAGLFAALVCGGTPAIASSIVPAAHQPTYAEGDARAPFGWVDFCRRMPSECEIDRTQPDRVTMTPHLWKLVGQVNTRVNREIEPMTDQAHWGTVESWDIPTDGIGDCEDYALLKRQRLSAAGVPRRALRMTVVIDEVGDGHAVLMLRTDRGDFILDNKRDDIRAWADTGYTFVKREHESRIGWTSLGGARSPLATAAR